MEARRQLKQEATHHGTKQVGNETKISDQSFCSLEALDVGNQFADLNRVYEVLLCHLLPPRLDGSHGWPRIERSIQLDRSEMVCVMSEPLLGWNVLGVKDTTPMPIKPT